MKMGIEVDNNKTGKWKVVKLFVTVAQWDRLLLGTEQVASSITGIVVGYISHVH